MELGGRSIGEEVGRGTGVVELEFIMKRFRLGLHWRGGLRVAIRAIMKDGDNKQIWKRHSVYITIQHKKPEKIKAYLADNGKLLREEMVFAADYIASDLAAHFRGEVPDKMISY